MSNIALYTSPAPVSLSGNEMLFKIISKNAWQQSKTKFRRSIMKNIFILFIILYSCTPTSQIVYQTDPQQSNTINKLTKRVDSLFVNLNVAKSDRDNFMAINKTVGLKFDSVSRLLITLKSQNDGLILSNKNLVLNNDTLISKINVLTIRYDSLKNNPPVTPEPIKYFLSSNTLKTLQATGDQDNLNLTNNVLWSINSKPDWVTVSPQYGTNSGSVLVSVQENTGGQRTGNIIVSSDQIASITIPVVQNAALIVKKTLAVDYLKTFESITGDKDYFKVTSDTDWKIKSYPNWVTISPLSGAGNLNVNVTVNGNPVTETRQSKIVLSGTNARDTFLIVNQKAGEAYILLIGKDTLEIPKLAGQISFPFQSNIDWSISGNKSWMFINPVMNAKEDVVTVNYSDNTGPEREAVISMTAYNGAIQLIRLIQKGQ